MSNSENNKEIVRSWIDALNRNDTAAVLAIYADDIHITTMGNTLISGRYGPADVKTFVTSVLDVFPQGLKFTVGSMTAEDDRVSVEAVGEGEHVSGKTYLQHYHFLVTVAGGRISELKEYLDTEHVTDVLCGGKK